MPASVPGRVTRDDLYLKARVLADGVNVIGEEAPSFRELANQGCAASDRQWDPRTVDDLLGQYADITSGAGNTLDREFLLLDDIGMTISYSHNPHSRLDLIREGERAMLKEGEAVVAECRIVAPEEPDWHREELSGGVPMKIALPFASESVINVVFSLSCYNFNTPGKACQYCNLFSNPISRRTNNLPIETLRAWVALQAEAIKIATDNGWRGALAISGGALPPKQRPQHLERLEVLMEAIRERVDPGVLSEIPCVYNHFPPEDFRDMERWREMGIGFTCIDLEVMDAAFFAAICPGKNEYKPLSYWKEAQEVAVEVFGPMKTRTNVVFGLEPMHTLLAGAEERLTKGILPRLITFVSRPESNYWGHRLPNADWILEASERMADLYLEYVPRLVQTAQEGGSEPSTPGRRAGDAFLSRLTGAPSGDFDEEAGSSLIPDFMNLKGFVTKPGSG